MGKKISRFWSNNKGIVTGLFLLLFFRSAVADWYHIPSGSMQPNILIGDRVWVNKLAYDVKIPFSGINLNRHSEPLAGDVIVFDSDRAGERLIKRVIALPGDSVAMLNGLLYVNGDPLKIEDLQTEQPFDEFMNDRSMADYYREFPSGLVKASDKTRSVGYAIRFMQGRYGERSFPQRKVAADHYWVMGDNRDNSADSRVIDSVPRRELIGRAERIVVSFDSQNYYFPRNGRFWEPL